MRKYYLYSLIIFLLSIQPGHAQEEGTIIDVNEAGFCSAEGVVSTSTDGHTGNGYLNMNNAEGVSAIWSVNAPEAGTYQIRWRYGFGGNEHDRHGEIWVNEEPSGEVVEFEHTEAWTNWTHTPTISVELDAGPNIIRMTSLTEFGLPNLDYLHILDEQVSGSECLPYYSLKVESNVEDGGSVSLQPEQAYYEEGTMVNVSASPGAGYFFHSWSGSNPSTEADYSFPIGQHSVMTAMFYPEGTTPAPDASGYASIQDNKGTPFLLNGGSLGDTVEATNAEELQMYLNSDEPLVVTVAGKISGNGTSDISIRSNKTLLGITDTAHIEGYGLQISEAQNVIIKNMILSYRKSGDLLEITHNSRNVWIDQCEFFNDTDHHKDYYDELFNIKNGASFITVSRTTFRDHLKGLLLSSGDQQVQDTVIRVTFHHNYFYNVSSRLPSLRFGKAHIFNNYYKESGDGINTRMGACIRVEGNYFEDMSNALHNDYSEERGAFHLLDNNVFVNASVSGTEYTCELPIPYEYEELMVDAEELPEILPIKISDRTTPYADEDDEDDDDGLTTAIPDELISTGKVYCYPNPSKGQVNFAFELEQRMSLTLSIYDRTGRKVSETKKQTYMPGKHELNLNTSSYEPGLYLYHLATEQKVFKGKIVLE